MWNADSSEINRHSCSKSVLYPPPRCRSEQLEPFRSRLERAGDPAELVADSTRLQSTLGWKPKYTELRDIVQTAFDFERKHQART